MTKEEQAILTAAARVDVQDLVDLVYAGPRDDGFEERLALAEAIRASRKVELEVKFPGWKHELLQTHKQKVASRERFLNIYRMVRDSIGENEARAMLEDWKPES